MSKHYHILIGGPGGFPVSLATMDDAHESVDAFVGLCDQYFKEFIDPVAKFEQIGILHERVDREEDIGVFVEIGATRIAWFDCRQCNKFMLN